MAVIEVDNKLKNPHVYDVKGGAFSHLMSGKHRAHNKSEYEA